MTGHDSARRLGQLPSLGDPSFVIGHPSEQRLWRPGHWIRRRMLTALRHVLAILILPTTVTIVVPRWILRAWASGDTRWPPGAASWMPRALGVLLVVAGLALVAWCISLFWRIGKGTLAPWDPTKRLVAVGPYRYTRNPMITGVCTILTGEALATGSWRLAAWAGTFIVINHVHFLLWEEPGLEQRFGESYAEYKRTVPRWIPRIRR